MTQVRALLLVGSDVTSDARVLKGVATLQRAGFDVRVLFTTKQGGQFPPTIDGIPIEHLEVPDLDLGKTPHLLVRIAAVARSRGGFATGPARRSAIHRAKLRDRETAARIARRKATLKQRAASSHLVSRLASRLFEAPTRLAIRTARLRLKVRRRTLRFRLDQTGRGAPAGPFQSDGAGELSRRDVRANWRERLPDLAAMELVFGPRIDELAPQILHVHDHHLLPTAAEAVVRSRAAGRETRLIYDAHEFVRGLTTLHEERRRAIAGMEARFVPQVDAVITVSEALAEQLSEDHGIPRPAVVMNAPRRRVDADPLGTTLRSACDLESGTPLLVYSGNVTPARGVHTLIEAMPYLGEEVHVALVVNARVRYLDDLLGRASELGVEGRLHLAPYVDVDHVAHYLRDATVGVHPMLHYPNAEIALPNKLFEYAHAGLPVVVSDCAAQKAFVEGWGFGESFRAGDPSDLADKVLKVLEDPTPYRGSLTDSVLDQLSWEGQEGVLLEVYDRLAGPADRP